MTEEIEDLIEGPTSKDESNDGSSRIDIDTEPSVQEKLQKINKDLKEEGNQLYAQVKLKTGGVLDKEGNQIDELFIKEPSPEMDMMLMDADFGPSTIRKIVLGAIDTFGNYDKSNAQEKKQIANMVFKDMLLTDYMYILMKIRQLSVGNILQFQSTCDQCGHKDTYDVKLSDLDYKNIDDVNIDNRERVDIISRFQESGMDMDWTIHWHFTTNEDQRKLEKLGKKLKNSGKDDSEMSLFGSMLFSRVDMVEEPDGTKVLVNPDCTRFEDEETISPYTEKDGERTKTSRMNYLTSLPHFVKINFQKIVDDHEPSIDTKVFYDCDNCGEELTNIIFPLDPNFFFPSKVQD